MSLNIQDIRCNSGNVYENKADNRLFELIDDIPGMSTKTKLLSSELHARIEWNSSCDFVGLAAVRGLRAPQIASMPLLANSPNVNRVLGWQADPDATDEALARKGAPRVLRHG